MRCTNCRDNFTDYLEDSLPPPQREQMAAHLRECADCAAELTALRRTVAALHSLPTVSPPADLLARINRAVDAQTTTPRFRVSWQRLGTVAAAATLLLGFWAVLSYQRPGTVTQGISPALRFEHAARETDVADHAPPAGEEEPAELEAAAAPAPEVIRETPPPAVVPRRERPAPAVIREVQPEEHPPAPEPVHAEERRPEEGTDGTALDITPPGGELDLGMAEKGRGPAGMTVERHTLTLSTGPAAPPVAKAQAGARMVVTPPPLEERIVGETVQVQVAIQPEADVEEAQVRVETKGSLRLAEDKPVIYQGPLAMQDSKRLAFGIIAAETGAQELRVDLTSELPGVCASTPVTIPGFELPPQHLTTQVFHGTPLDQAIRAVAQEAKLKVSIGERVGQEAVSADFSAGVPGQAALRILAESADCSLRAEGDTCTVYRPAPDNDAQ